MAGQELLTFPAVQGMLLGEEIFSLGHVPVDRSKNCASVKKEVFQLRWGGLMETEGGDWIVLPTLGHIGVIPHRLTAPRVLRSCSGQCRRAGALSRAVSWIGLTWEQLDLPGPGRESGCGLCW